MKGQDVALFVSIQGILLGAAFLLSSGGVGMEGRTSQIDKPDQVQSWTNTSPTSAQSVARQMNMQAPDSFRQVGRADSVTDSRGLSSSQRRWVF
jgi:hypothetical protein